MLSSFAGCPHPHNERTPRKGTTQPAEFTRSRSNGGQRSARRAEGACPLPPFSFVVVTTRTSTRAEGEPPNGAPSPTRSRGGSTDGPPLPPEVESGRERGPR